MQGDDVKSKDTIRRHHQRVFSVYEEYELLYK